MSTQELIMEQISLLDEEQQKSLLLFLSTMTASVPNAETVQAIEDTIANRNLVGPFESVAAMMEALDADD